MLVSNQQQTKGSKMFELIFEGRVQARGSKEAMQEDRRRIAEFTGREIAFYQIVEVSR